MSSRIVRPKCGEPGVVEDRRSGFTLLEVTVGIVFLAIAFLGFSTFLIQNEALHEHSAQHAAVSNALRRMAEQIRRASFTEIASSYQGYSFTVDEVSGVGTVTVFLNEADSSVDAAQLGLPRDLDGDGNASTGDVSGGYILLPIKIEATWTGREGNETKAHFFLLSQED